ncbi:MAG: alpha/beta fold hydrolase [Microthrixaceae bacterium]
MAAPQPHLVLLHGFTQTSGCWGPFADRLSESGPTDRLDLPGHGAGGAPLDGWATASRLAEDAAGPGVTPDHPGDWLGYSLGGRMLLHLLLTHPGRVGRAVLIGATAGIEDPGDRQARRRDDEALADRIERDGVDAFLERWMAMPMWADLPAWAHFGDQRRTNTPGGLAGSLRLAGTGAQDNLWPRLGEIETPVLVLAGERDEKFTAIGRRLAGDLPRGEFRSLAGAGHAAHLEQPDRTAELVETWLGRRP